MTNNEKFLEQYKQLESALKIKYRIADNGVSPVAKFEYESPLPISERVSGVRGVRNLLTHNGKWDGVDMVQVSDEVLAFLQNLIDTLKHPKRAQDVCTKIGQVRTSFDVENAKNLIEEMEQKNITHVPILNDIGALVGVFSESTLFSCMSHCPDLLAKPTLQVKDFDQFTALKNHNSEIFEFVSLDTPLAEIKSRFEHLYPEKKRLELIFVTKSGSADQAVYGLITAWDLIEDL